MAIERIKLRNIADLSIVDKVHCCYFDEGNLQDMKEDLKVQEVNTN